MCGVSRYEFVLIKRCGREGINIFMTAETEEEMSKWITVLSTNILCSQFSELYLLEHLFMITS